ncbi:hypothetical protein [Sphingosinicella sp. BN140058]|uniref:hypothetical protein n=1 Tax=Sphingosinicella sp. BN140058 TaxID=1892855 RepID=UPI00101068C8|nr:hypothetical protein [Sphingosinicella sp. BN140058]QAY78981.1 hypothetical protein ETR14_22410 [Sphingosinicella sp. BN140058]
MFDRLRNCLGAAAVGSGHSQPPLMELSAVAYLANGKLIIAPVVRTTDGLGLEVEPSTLGGSPDEDSIAEALSGALTRSGRVVPHPAQSEWKGVFQPFLKAASVRSYKAFMKDARTISIRATENALELTPYRNLGSKEGFQPMPEEVVLLHRDDLKGAAQALLRLAGLSTG